MVGINKIRRLAYQTAVVGAAAAALSLTAAAHSSNSSANPFSRDRSGEIWVTTDHMTSVGWRVPDRLTQEAALPGVAAPFDILVIGGGVTGCGVALDAATRGLRVGLVDRDDYSAGTSSRSTKLVHGGMSLACVRYLEKAFWQFDYGQLKLVFHALEERAHILQNAPHLCNALPTMTPCYEWDLRFITTYAGGRFRIIGQMNDSQLNVAIACTAALVGPVVLNHAEAISLKKDEVTGNVTGAHIRNKLTGNEFDVHVKVVIMPRALSVMSSWDHRLCHNSHHAFEAHEEDIEFILDAISDYLVVKMEGLGKRLAHGYPYLEAEVAYCARNEYCESAVDFLARRARLAFLDTDAADRALPRVIEILAAEHRWDKARRKAEMADVNAFLETFKSSKNAQFDDGKHRAR
ncbi:unnamed protein product [Sphagnum compactum]